MKKLGPIIISLGSFFPLMGTAQEFDPKPWLEDLSQSRAAFTEKYANFDWAIFERQIDLSKLFAETRDRVATAGSDVQAKAAFDRLARQLGDGHVEFQWPNIRTGGGKDNAPGNACADLGYEVNKLARPLASHIRGYKSISQASQEFPAGLLTVGDTKIGIVKIGLFSPQGSPSLCETAIRALKISANESCDDACSDTVEQWAAEKMTGDLEETLAALQKAGATTLLIDITQNGGGNEWTEAAARMVTGVPLVSERLGFVCGAHWVKKWSDLAADLRKAAASAPRDREQILLARPMRKHELLRLTALRTRTGRASGRPANGWATAHSRPAS